MTATAPDLRARRRALAALRRDRRAMAMTEFALGLPILLPLGLYGIEMANYAVVQLQLSQATMALADNASRAGADTNNATQQLRDVDVNDVLQGFRLQTRGLNATTQGRITLSSLEVNPQGGQWIRWQRCIGLKRGTGYDSATPQGTGLTGTAFTGMGQAGNPVTAPPGAAVMVVEVSYDYAPLISGYFVGRTRLTSNASFIVRDKRDLGNGISNPSPAAVVASCTRYTT